MSIAARVQDKEYQAELTESIAAQRRIRTARTKIEARMAALRERAKKALPAGATEDQVKAELEDNPLKYPTWRELVAAKKSSIAEEQRSQAAAQAAFRRKKLREEAKRSAQGAASEKK